MIVGWHKSIVSSDWSDTILDIAVTFFYHPIYIWSLVEVHIAEYSCTVVIDIMQSQLCYMYLSDFSVQDLDQLSQEDEKKLEAITVNRRVQFSTYIAFMTTYLIIMLFGFMGNAYIILACLRNKLLKTTRNILIANIAVADILLCLFTMPLSMLDMVHNYWPLGSGQEILCQLGTT